ncbi:MAG TPA: hypothetical protein ENN80_08675 [Candidatus Hydrogenedentes bacterium]|nr:hypothetical protein [Candidatus Hydrogenedentota bacterium]
MSVVASGVALCAFYRDTDKILVVARRNLDTHDVQALRLPDFRLTINPNDGHRSTVLGISPQDGRLHLSWDHHNNDLRYTRSPKGFITDPPETITLGNFEPAQGLMPDARQSGTREA